MRTGIRINAVAGAKDPEALACLILDNKVVAHGIHLGVALPPLSKMRSGPSARLTLRRLPRQTMDTGGRSGISAIASISSGRGRRRTGRRQWLTQATAIGSATGLIRWTERSGTSDATGATR